MSKTQEPPERKDRLQPVYFFSKLWWGLYLGMAVLTSLVLLIVVLFPAGITVRSDVVFGFLVLASVLVTDLIFRKAIKRRMLISKKLSYSILYAVIPLSFYIMLARPFE